MKKIIVALLTIIMALGLLASVQAAEAVKPGDEDGTISLIKKYDLNDGAVAPAETLTFTVKQESGVDDRPITFGTGDVHSFETTGEVETALELSFPDYDTVGVWTYSIVENEGNTAGVTYDTNPIIVVVTVTNKNTENASSDELQATVAVHKVSKVDDELTDDNKIDPEKDAAFLNEVGQGKLSVEKQVTGKLASNTYEFEITVTFDIPEGKVLCNEVIYDEAGVEGKTVSFDEDGHAEVVLHLSSTKSANFSQIPDGVTYSVVENEDHAEGNQTPELMDESKGYVISYDGNEEGTISAGETISTVVTNDKDTDIDTGIVLDSLPYILIAVAVMAAVVVMIAKKRRVED